MKKILSLFIIFLFFFYLLPVAFASETDNIDINDFEEFSILQVQNTFSNSLSQERSDDKTETQTKNICFLSDIDYSLVTFFCYKKDYKITSFCFDDIGLYGFDCFYRNKIFYKKKSFNGISEFKIEQNSYIAIVLFDTVNFVYI